MPKRPQPRELSRTLTIIGFTTFDIININLILSVTLFPVLCRAFNFFFFFGRYMAVHGELNYCESCFRFNAYHTTLFVCNILKILPLYIYYKIIILQHCDIFPSFLLPFSVCVYFLFLLISQNAVKFIVFRSWSHSLKKKKIVYLGATCASLSRLDKHNFLFSVVNVSSLFKSFNVIYAKPTIFEFASIARLNFSLMSVLEQSRFAVIAQYHRQSIFHGSK